MSSHNTNRTGHSSHHRGRGGKHHQERGNDANRDFEVSRQRRDEDLLAMGLDRMSISDNKEQLSYLLERAEADHQVADAYQSRLPTSDDDPPEEALYDDIHTPAYYTAEARGGASPSESGNAVLYHRQLESGADSSYLPHTGRPGTSYPSGAGSWQPHTALTAPMGAGDVSFWSSHQDATAGPNKLAPRKLDRRPEIPRGYASDEDPGVQSYLQNYLYNKGKGWRLSKLCDPCSRANAPAGSCTRGDSDHKCAQCRDKGKGKGKGRTCGWNAYKAAKASLKKKAGQEADEEESYAERQVRERREKRHQDRERKERETEGLRERLREEQRRRPIEESCVYQPNASFVHAGEMFGAGADAASYDSQPAASVLAYQLPASMGSEANVPYWSTAPSESGTSFGYGGTGCERASYSTASSIPDDYTIGSHTPVPYSTHTAAHQPPYAQQPSQGGLHRDALPHRHVDGEWQYDESSGTFMQTRMIPEKREPEVSAEQVQQYVDQHRQPHEDQRLTRVCDPCHFGGLPGCRFSHRSYPLGWCTTCQSTPGSSCTVDMYDRAHEKVKREKEVEAWMEKRNRKNGGH